MNIDFKLPELGENIHSGDVVNVLVQEGDVIAANDGVVELETDKAVVEIPCPYAGRVAKLLVKKGDTVKVGQAILTIASGETASGAAPRLPRHRSAQALSHPGPARRRANRPTPLLARGKGRPAAPALLDRPGPIPAGPAVRRLAREQGVDLRTVAGSGKFGRITAEDLQAVSAAGPTAPPSPALVPVDPSGPVASPASVPSSERVGQPTPGGRSASRKSPASAARSPSR